MDNPLVQRMRGFGATIFDEMTALARRHDAINLGQGAPDTDGPPEILEAARAAITEGVNQYPPGRGFLDLRLAIAEHQRRFWGMDLDPETEVVVSGGATEAVTAALLALCEPGDEVVALDPTYDSYAAAITMAQARLVPVTLRAPDFALDLAELRAAVTDRTRLLLINSPHNPTGHVLTADEREGIARVAIEHDLLVVTDEVYEHLTFDHPSGASTHRPLATLPGMAERTVTISSAGKTFSVTGWKVGWLCGPVPLMTAIMTTKQFLTYANAAPLQPAVAVGLRLPDSFFENFRLGLQAQRDLLVAGLADTGFEVLPSAGTYFVNVDITPLADGLDGVEFCRLLPQRCGVAAIPSQVFHADPSVASHLVRFAFCKRPEVLSDAVARLQTLRTGALR